MRTLLACGLLGFGGCASILTGGNETVWLRSDPPGQTVTIDGREYITPCDVVVRRGEEHVVVFADGQRVDLKHSAWGNPAIWCNLIWTPSIIGTLVAVGIDMGTGAQHDLEPDHLYWFDAKVYDVERDALPPESPYIKVLAGQRRARARRDAERRESER